MHSTIDYKNPEEYEKRENYLNYVSDLIGVSLDTQVKDITIY